MYMKPTLAKKTAGFVLLALLPFVNYAQQPAQASSSQSYLSNALFITLSVVIIALLALTWVIGSVIRNVVASNYFKEKLMAKNTNNDNKSNIGKTLSVLLVFMLTASTINAQEKVAVVVEKDSWLIGGLDMFTFYSMIAIIIVELGFLAVLINILRNLLKEDVVEVAIDSLATKVPEKTILDKFNASVEIEKEGEIMLDHNYDGIRELDNNLPPWWKYGFAVTVVVAIIYLTNYHLAKTGDLQTAEYNKEMERARVEVEEYLKTSANNVDENSIKLLTKADDVEAGKQTFLANCIACHGKLANGKIGENDGAGPNLTDNYWLHGGSIQDVFKSIKYGWTDKGMKSWKEDLSPMQIAQVASYIKTLKGTSPGVGKAAQGEVYQDAGSPTVLDSSAMPADSIKIKAIADSLDIALKEKK